MGYIGFQLGLSTELTKFVGLCGGILMGFRYYQGWGDFVSQRTFLSIEWAAAAMMVVLVGGGYLAITQLICWLEKVVKLTFQNTLASGVGLIVGLLRAVLVMSVMLVALRQVPSPYIETSIESRSLMGGYLVLVAPRLYDTISGFFQALLDRLEV